MEQSRTLTDFFSIRANETISRLMQLCLAYTEAASLLYSVQCTLEYTISITELPPLLLNSKPSRDLTDLKIVCLSEMQIRS